MLLPLRRCSVLCFPGKVLSVTWSADANYIYSGSNDGYVLASVWQHQHSLTYFLIGVVTQLSFLFMFLVYFIRLIRCWNATLSNEIYRITAGLGGLGSGDALCIWSLLSLR